jgi:hypothetical protein
VAYLCPFAQRAWIARNYKVVPSPSFSDLLKRFSFVVSSGKGKLKPFLFVAVCPGSAGQASVVQGEGLSRKQGVPD